MRERVFWKAIHCLSHPLSLGALAILLVNDHLLRRVWPSWVTGKIGDLAWLFFIPFVLAAVLAWLVPPRGARHEKVVGWLAFGLTGAVFALTKTHPGFHAWVVQATETLLGSPVSIQRDGTDLFALASLGLSWWFWGRRPVRKPAFGMTGWVLLPLGALLTIANSAAEDYGIECLMVDAGQIRAASVQNTFLSADGGLSWQSAEWEYETVCAGASVRASTDSDDPDAGFAPDASVYSPASQAERAYYEKTRSGNVFFSPGPHDTRRDPITGNTIFAMGHEGVLVRTASDDWRWVPVGEYRRVRLTSGTALVSLLSGESILALGFGLLCMSTWILRLKRSVLRAIFIVTAWGLWGFSVIVFPPALTTGYGTIIVYGLLIVTAPLVLVVVLVSAILGFQGSVRLLIAMGIAAVGGMLLFLLPYVLWALEGLPNYTAAVLFAFALGAATLLVGDRVLKRQGLAAPESESGASTG